MTRVIEAFVEAYGREVDFYQEAARLCAQRCDMLLEVNGIRAMVTHRAKRPDRLRDKLLKRHSEKNYKSEEEIRSDMVDLAGVRIALYFPGDRAEVGKLLFEEFTIAASKDFPETASPRKDKRFSGYHATHHRARLRSEDLPDSQRRYASAPIEIQVGSVLMHAWSEVEHDLIYKPASGELSQDEYAILDELNGLVLAGEIGLERLQRAVETRVAKRGSRFSNHFELAAFLYEESKRVRAPTDGEPSMGRLDILLNLLRGADLDNAEAVRPFVEALAKDTEARPIADRIADQVLEKKPELYQSFSELIAKARGPDPYAPEDRKVAQQNLIGEFLSQWIVFERFYRAVIGVRDPANRRYFPATGRTLLGLEAVDRETAFMLDRFRDLRNRLVHGTRIPDDERLSRATTEFASILSKLDSHPDSTIRTAMRWARSGRDDPNDRNLVQIG